MMDENEMLAAVIGARISEAIFPAPLKNKIRNAVDYLLKNNNPDFLDTARLENLKILDATPVFENTFPNYGWIFVYSCVFCIAKTSCKTGVFLL